ncbi:DUF1566 domain-containing protein [Vibrio sp. CAU 1672]|uniref:Lcl C-terminal domain-containing protein n=1 Tax=Vibrio sp. CAU 1672 TaxID=3032594 RepID=UPI0023D9857F|nr:DUF1566 domain-containing protein [Vibrio sp. CAU 1672]MDF2152679.1 DUF1566 domain-containing protein [Vibrio sp. CAU 1672]
MNKLVTALSLILATQTALAAQECSADYAKTTPNTRYTYSENGTVTDLKTGLTWIRCPVGATWNAANEGCSGSGDTVTWQSALLTAQQIRDESGNHTLHQFAGKKHWRLPNIKELVALTERACHSPAMNGTAFASGYTLEVGDFAGYIWSNTPNGDGTNVMVFDSVNGEVYNYNPSTAAYQFSVLLVTDED